MKRGVLFALSAIMVFGFARLANANPDTFADARAMAAELDKPLLLEFFTDW
jgi:hypothetical protein